MNRPMMGLAAVLLVVAWIVNDHYPPWSSAHAELASILAVFALAAALARRRAVAYGLDTPVVFLLGVAVIPIAQALAGKVLFFGDAWVCCLYVMAAAFAAQVSRYAATNEPDAWPVVMATAILAGALLNSLIAMLQQWSIRPDHLGLFVMDLQPGHAPWGNLGQPNQLTDLLFLGIAATGFLYEQRRVSAGWAAACVVILTFTLVLTYSRTPLLLFAAALLWQMILSGRLRLRTPRWVIPGLAALWAGLYAIWPRALSAMDIASGQSLEGRLQAGPRTVIWGQLWDALWLQPWTGWGWNQVSVAQMTVAEKLGNSRMTEFSHNLLLDLAIWNGLPIGLLIVAAGSWWLVRACGQVKSKAGAFGLLIMLSLLAHSMVEFPLTYLYFLVPFGFALGIVMHDLNRQAVLVLPRSFAVAAVATGLAVTIAAAVDYWRLEEDFRDMRMKLARIGGPMPESAPPELRSQFTQLSAQHHFWLTTPTSGMDEAEIGRARKVAMRYGYAPILYRYALIQGMNGDIPGAKLTLQRLRNLHDPHFYEVAMNEIRNMAKTDHPELRALL